MPHDARVRHAAVRQQVRAGRKNRKQHLGTMPAHARERQRIERRRGDRAGRAVVGAPLAVAEEVVAVPARRLVEAAQIRLFEFAGMEHAFAARGARQQRHELGANRGRSRLEFFDLGNQALVEIRRRRQAREKQERRLLARIRIHRRLQVQMDSHRLFHAPHGAGAVLPANGSMSSANPARRRSRTNCCAWSTAPATPRAWWPR